MSRQNEFFGSKRTGMRMQSNGPKLQKREGGKEKKRQSKDKDARRLRMRTQKELFPIHKKGEMERTILGNTCKPKAQTLTTHSTAKKQLTKPLFQKVDRNRRRHDGNHGPIRKLQPHHHTNGTRTLQIPHQIFFASEDSKGIFHPLFPSSYPSTSPLLSSTESFYSLNASTNS